MKKANYMVTIKFAESWEPKSYFFNDPLNAEEFYDSKVDEYRNSLAFRRTEVCLWISSDDGRSWKLNCSNCD